MTSMGQLCLLMAMICSGYAAFAVIVGARSEHRGLGRSAVGAACTAFVALTVVITVLGYGLVTKDFRFEYVTQYSDPLLPWHYSLSALWVGQAGSLLVWGWFVAVLAVIFRFTSRRGPRELRELAFGIQMIYLGFLLAIMVFAADPMAPALVPGAKGEGLSPLLQHPAMLIHPPIVFLGYAAWGIPFALAAAALISGRLNNAWLQQARSWSLFAWTTLGGGILLGGQWAYEQLGWGGYWAWDPVENGSLMPWLTGTALIHGLMTWRQGALKKTTLFLAITTFGLCNFATFLTRSGIFSSLHAFSQSPIGWMFLVWIAASVLGGAVLILLRKNQLMAEKPLAALGSREALVLMGILALVLLTTVTLLGTLAGAISGLFSTTRIVVGMAFYNNVLIPTGLVLLAVVASVPLIRWGAGPTRGRVRLLAIAAIIGFLVALAALACGVSNPISLTIAGLMGVLLASTFLAIAANVPLPPAYQPKSVGSLRSLFSAFTRHRRSYAGLLIHLGFGCMAVGITGSSLGSRETDLSMTRGQTVEFEGRTIHYADLLQQDLRQKVVVAAQLEVNGPGGASYTLEPAQILYRPQNQWGSKVAIHSTFGSDFYVIMHGGSEAKKIHLTLIDHPLICWLWIGGWIGLVGVVIALLPQRQRRESDKDKLSAHPVVPCPHLATLTQHARHD
ncbi:MAG: cytochrome c-type biogenesis CcmF C-terminal domain-containing protein [Planctomycetota bacterium]